MCRHMFGRILVLAYVPGEAVDGRSEGSARLSHQLHASVCVKCICVNTCYLFVPYDCTCVCLCVRG